VFLLLLVFPSAFAQPLNDYILKEAYRYTSGRYVLSSTGCPEHLVYADDTILKKSASGTYCSGYTFTVFFNTMKEHHRFEGKSSDELRKIQKDWYGITRDATETQCLFVLEQQGWGRKIAFDEAQPGDFVQFWRNNQSGHSVIFLGWERDSTGHIIAMKYRSSQLKTDGVGDRTELIGSGPKELNRNRIYLARLE
jgi:hypothetical protein